MTPEPTPSPTATAVTTVIHVAQLAPEQWQVIGVAVALVVFTLGVLLVAKL